MAHVKALEYLNKTDLTYDTFNIGTGKGSTVLEAIKAFEETTSQKLNYKIGNRRAGDIEKVWADCTKANTVLGWQAKFNIKQMMLDAWNWQIRLEK